MRKFIVRSVFAVAALVQLAVHDSARAVDIVPPAVIDHWLDLAQKIRALGFCGYSPTDPALSLNRNIQENFARGVNEDTLGTRTRELESTLAKCSFCSAYAKLAVAAAYDNELYTCGFKGPLWNKSEAYHFNGCMAIEHCEGSLFGDYCAGDVGVAKDYLNPDTGERTQKIAQCKLTHSRRDCRSCHESQSSSAVQATARRGSSVQDALRRVSKPEKTSVSSSGNDLAKPSGGGHRGGSVLGPGLLEGGQDLSSQGPAAIGTPGASGGTTRVFRSK